MAPHPQVITVVGRRQGINMWELVVIAEWNEREETALLQFVLHSQNAQVAACVL